MEITKILKDIKDILYLYELYSPHFSTEEILIEEIDIEKANGLIRRTINDIVTLRHSIEQGKLIYREEEFYNFLKAVIELNTEFHQQNNINSKIEKELQDKLMFNLKVLNDTIIEWNSKNKQKIMTIQQAREKYNQNIKEGLKFFDY